jgi:hypothetical protein
MATNSIFHRLQKAVRMPASTICGHQTEPIPPTAGITVARPSTQGLATFRSARHHGPDPRPPQCLAHDPKTIPIIAGCPSTIEPAEKSRAKRTF